jgi:hypothetical protein
VGSDLGISRRRSQNLRRRPSFGLVLLALLIPTIPSSSAFSAIYRKNTWLLSGYGGYLPLNAEDLDNVIVASDVVPQLRGLIAGKLQVERGMVEPNWSHWLDFGVMGGSLVAAVPAAQYSRSLLTFYTVAGATWWFRIGSLVDFGLGAGVGLGFASMFSARANSQTFDGSGGVYPVLSGRGNVRFWITDYIGISTELGLRFAPDTITDSTTGQEVSAQLHGFSVHVGATWAITRIGGTGYSFVQVLTPEERAKIQKEKRAKEEAARQKAEGKKASDAERKKRLNEAQ